MEPAVGPFLCYRREEKAKSLKASSFVVVVGGGGGVCVCVCVCVCV